MEHIHIAKTFLEEGLIILSEVKRETPNEPVDLVIAPTVKRLKRI